MDDVIEEFGRKIRAGMLEDMREKYGELFFERWQHPLYLDAMADPDVMTLLKGTCGDSILLFLKFTDGVVAKATFKTDGCATSIVCGSFAAELALGKTPDELLQISGHTIMDRFGGLPDGQQHCAFHAASVLHKAAGQYLDDQRKRTDR